MSEAEKAEILRLNERLLQSIAKADWKTYADLVDNTITCFEPEARGHLVEGMPFHKFYFDLGASSVPRTDTMASPHVRLMGDAAVVTYIRLVQKLSDGGPSTSATEETRVWQKIDGQWKHVHIHRSPLV